MNKRLAAVVVVLAVGAWLALWGVPVGAVGGLSIGATRIMDGVHNQVATVNHTGGLVVTCQTAAGVAETCGGSGGGGDAVNVFHQSTIRHISSVTHIAGGISVVSQSGTYVTVTGTALDVNCTGCAAASVVNVFHISSQLHVRLIPSTNANDVIAVHMTNLQHITSVTHVYGRVMLSNQAGTYITATGTALDVNCTGCSSASVVNVAHVSAVTHVAIVGWPQWFHINSIGHITGAIHLAGGVTDQNNNALRVTGVTVFTIMGAIDHIANVTHVSVADWRPWFHLTGVQHITSVTHVVGRVMLSSQAGTFVTVTGTALDVNCTGCSASSVVNVQHVSAVTHVAVVGWPQWFHVTNIAHITSAVHVSGQVEIVGRPRGPTNWVDVEANAMMVNVVQAAHVSGVTHVTLLDWPKWFHMTNLQHITSVAHIYGRVMVVSQAGVYATITGSSLDVNVTNSVTVLPGNTANTTAWLVNIQHISSAVHLAGGVTDQHAKALRVIGTHETGAIHVVGISNIGSGAPQSGTTAMSCHTTLAVHVAAAAPGFTQLIHLTSTNLGVNQSSWRIYICGIVLISSHAQGFSLVEGTGTTCATGQRPVMGSIRVDDSMPVAANGGISSVAAFPWISTQNPGNNLCIAQSSRSTGTVSGVITFRAGS